MKKLIYIFVGLAAFSIGIAVYYLQPIVTAVPLCEISQHVELYEFNEIRIKAYLDGAGITEDDFNFYSVSDFNNSCLTGASLEISEALKNDDAFKKLARELRQKNTYLREKKSDGVYIAEVEILGEIKKQLELESAPLVAPPPFIIKTKEIKQISPIRFLSYEEISNFHISK